MPRETKAQKDARLKAEAEAEAAQAAADAQETADTTGAEVPADETPADDADATDGEGVEGAENGEGETSAEDAPAKPGPRAGSMPVYKVQRAELPAEDEPAVNHGRKLMYHGLLNTIVEDEESWGEWFEVATFKTVSGAREAEKAIEKGDRIIPEGEWEFATRKVKNGDNPDGKRWSKLFAQYMGPADDDDEGGGDTDGDEAGDSTSDSNTEVATTTA